MTVHWAVVPAPRPIGALTVVVGDAGLCRVAFGSRPRWVDEVAARLHEDAVPGGAATEAVAGQLEEYLQGRRRVFDLALDWRLTDGTQRVVLQTLYREVGYGRTTSYAELARLSGAFDDGWAAARGVGAIMGSNPLPVVVPCHRVVAANGLGGFGGGRATKEWLLALEGVLPPALDLALDEA